MDAPEINNLEEKLRLLRLERGLSLEDIALRLGISNQMVYLLERGYDPKSIHWNGYIDILNVSHPYPLVYEDSNVVVKNPAFEQLDDPKASIANLSKRNLSNQDLEIAHTNKKGYFLYSYLLKLEQGAKYSVSRDTSTTRALVVLDGNVQINDNQSQKILSKGDCWEGDPVFCNIVKHSQEEALALNNFAPCNIVNHSQGEALVLDIGIKIPPHSEKKAEERTSDFDAYYENYEKLIAWEPRYGMRVVKCEIGPYPHNPINYHRSVWTEELIVVTEGEMEIVTKSPSHKDDKQLSKINEPIGLKAYESLHWDGRILRTMLNKSFSESVVYYMAYLINWRYLAPL